MKPRRFPTALFLFFAVLSMGVEVRGERVRVATLNVANYLPANRMVEGVYRKNYPKPEVEKAALRAVVRKINPDILALQEMGRQAYLLEFQLDLKNEGIEYPYATLVEGEDEERHLALLSKFPFQRFNHPHPMAFKYFSGREKLKRGLLEVEFLTGGRSWTLFNMHLKSRWTVRKDDPEAKLRRKGESLAIRDYLKKKFLQRPDPAYLLVGDMNDTRGSPVLRQLLKSGSSVLSLEVSAFDSRMETWTYHYRKEGVYEQVDFILASPSMAERLAKGRAAIVDLPEMPTASDHRMVYADLNF